MDQFYFGGQDLGLSTPWPAYDINTSPLPHLPSGGNIPHLSGRTQANNDLANGQASRHSSPLPDQTTMADVGTRKRKAPTLRAIDWEPVKCRIIELHITRNISLLDVQEHIKKEFGFEATLRQYRSRVTQWSLDKNVKKKEMQFIVQKQQERSIFEKDKRNRVFRIRGSVVEPKKISRWKKGNRIADDELCPPTSAAANTPAGLSYWTASEAGSPAEHLTNSANSPISPRAMSSPCPRVTSVSPAFPVPAVASPGFFQPEKADPSLGASHYTSQFPRSLDYEINNFQSIDSLLSFDMPPKWLNFSDPMQVPADSRHINVDLAAYISRTHLVTEQSGLARDGSEEMKNGSTRSNVAPSRFADVEDQTPNPNPNGHDRNEEMALSGEEISQNNIMTYQDVPQSGRVFAKAERFQPAGDSGESAGVPSSVSKSGSGGITTDNLPGNNFVGAQSDNMDEDGNSDVIEVVMEEQHSSLDDADDALVVIDSTAYERAINECILGILATNDDLDQALRFAAKTGDVHLVASLLERGANINGRSRGGMTACHLAAYMGHTDVLVILLDNDASVDCVDGEILFRTCGHNLSVLNPHLIHLAALRGHLSSLQVLLERCEGYHCLNEHMFNILKWAIDSGLTELAGIFLQRGTNVSESFLTAAGIGLDGALRVLLDRGGINHQTHQMSLQLASKNGHEAVVRFLLETGKADVDSEDTRRRTPLLLASENGHEAVVRLLLETGKANTDSKNIWGETPLLLASENGHEAVVRHLLETGKADANLKDTWGWTPLQYASEKGHEAVVRLLLETGKADANLQDNSSRTPLQYASKNGHEAVVRLLLETGKANADFKDTRGRTPLLLASKNGYEAVVRLLLETGKADTDSECGSSGRTPLKYVSENGHEAVVRLLLETGKANANLKDTWGWTPLQYASKNGHEAVVRVLLETGKADTNLKDTWGRTSLLLASENGHEAVVRLLLETGKADANLKNSWGRTPLQYASGNGHEAVVRLLLETGKADTNLKDAWGRTPLLLASKNGHEAVVRLLLETGKANADLKDTWGRTPLLLASENGHEAVVRLLLEASKVNG